MYRFFQADLSSLNSLRTKKVMHTIIKALFLFILLPSTVNAQLYQNLSIGNAKALSLAHAVTADPPPADALHFNPAGLFTSTKKGRTYSLHFVYLPDPEYTITSRWTGEYPESDLEINGCDTACLLENDAPQTTQQDTVNEFLAYVPWSGETKKSDLLPRGAYVSKNERFAYGIGTYATLGAGFKFPETGVQYSTAKLSGINLVFSAPGVAYQMAEGLTLGLSMPLNYSGFYSESAIRLPNMIAGLVATGIENICDMGTGELCTDDGSSIPLYDEVIRLTSTGEDHITPSFNLGFIWQPLHWFSLGGVYQSEVKHKTKGKFQIEYDESAINIIRTGILDVLPNSPNPESIPSNYSEEGNVVINQTLPSHAALGISVRVTTKIKVNVDIKRTDTSIFDETVLHFDRPTYLSAIAELVAGAEPYTAIKPVGYIDGWNFAQGMEYQWSDNLLVRLGYEWRKSVIPDINRTIASPLTDTKVVTFGGEYRLGHKTNISIALARITSQQYIPSQTSYTNTWDPTELFSSHPGYDLGTSFESYMMILGIQKTLLAD